MSAPCPCRHPGCGVLVRDGSGFCVDHKRVRKQEADARRGNATQRGYSYKWQQASKAFLAKHPLCECDDCGGENPAQISSVVDHTIPHRLYEAIQSGNADAITKARALFWDRSNWCAMSKLHHDRKTAREDGAFGRPGAGEILEEFDG